ncbi:MAG: hypothetical protein WC319_07780 [Candidatus Paceibacterota bacterium]|jgi:hypothetical protein
MPKISYLDILDNGADYTEVTASHIEQKIADIEALLRGMIDEDNLLAKDDGSGIVPISPSNVVDMPVETRPVQQCMKFFSNDEQGESIVSSLFDDITDRTEKNINMALVNSIGDKEIFLDLTIGEENYISTSSKTVDVEIPNYYVPMTYADLYELIKDTSTDLKLEYNIDEHVYTFKVQSTPDIFIDVPYYTLNPEVVGNYSSLDEVMEGLFKQPLSAKNDIVSESSYDIGFYVYDINYEKPEFDSKNNVIKFSMSAEIDTSVTPNATLCRLVNSFFCRVNP